MKLAGRMLHVYHVDRRGTFDLLERTLTGQVPPAQT
jgi:hypothetical protein